MAMKPEPFRGPIMEGQPGRYHSPSPVEFRLFLLNKRLREASNDFDNAWWEEMITDFFEDNATLSISMFMEEGPKQYAIGRTLLPRFFRSFYDGGVSELSFVTRHAKEMLNHATHSITLDSPQATMYSQHNKPIPTRICTEGHLAIEFSCDQFSRIRHFNFEIRGHCELVLRQAILQEPHIVEKLSGNLTKRGVNPRTINYLKLCEILEPMKEIMSRQKACNIDPRDCLRNCLFQKWQRMMNPPEPVQRGKTPRRKRKASSTTNTNPGMPSRKKNFPSSDVMVVGEPSIMGGDIGEEDERIITRLENQFDSVTGVKIEANDPQNPSSFSHNSSPAMRPNMNMSPWPQGQATPSQGRPPSQTGLSVLPNPQTPSRPDATTPDAMPNTPSSQN